MGSKIRVDQDFLDDFENDDLALETTTVKKKKRDRSHRRDIDNFIEDRRLKAQIRDTYDETYYG